MSGRLVVLGSCGAWPEAGRACSGFVLEHEGFRLVLDLGYATLPRLLALLGSSVADGIDAVVVTHRHADHAVDLHGLFRARWFGRRGAARPALYAPADVLDQLAALEEDDDAAIREVFDWHPLPGASYRVGPFTLRSWALPHFVLNAGVRLSTSGLTVAYTGDTGPDPALVELAPTPTSTSWKPVTATSGPLRCRPRAVRGCTSTPGTPATLRSRRVPIDWC